MARRSIHATLVLAAGLSLTCPAAAQQEQWLRYRTAAEPHQFIGSTYGQTRSPTSKPPEGLQLPKFTGDIGAGGPSGLCRNVEMRREHPLRTLAVLMLCLLAAPAAGTSIVWIRRWWA